MLARIFRVVTFCADPLRGNPAYVLTETGGADDTALSTASAMLRGEIIAVVGTAKDGEIPLRFSAPTGSHPGAGHATLAAAHVVLQGGLESPKTLPACVFRQANGETRPARRDGSRIVIDYPAMPGAATDLAAKIGLALGVRPNATLVAPFGHVAIFDDAGTVARLQPDLALVSDLDRNALIATAPGAGESDIVIRVFAPKAGLPEDPVCGTAHRIIVPYWTARLGKKHIHSRQLSARGGDLWCENKGDQISIAGESCLIVEGRIRIPN